MPTTNFTFVPHKGARPERSELVKSHVMRESQRKRREAKQRRNQNTSEATGNPSSNIDVNVSTAQDHTSAQVHLPTSYDFPASTAAAGDHRTAYCNPINALDIPPTVWTSSSGSSSGSAAISASNNIDVSWAGSQDFLLADSGQVASCQWPFNLPSEEEGINFDSVLGRQSPLFFENDTEGTSSGAFPLLPQPSLLYPSFVGDSSPSDPSWVSQPLFERVTELVSHYTATLNVERQGLPPINFGTYYLNYALVNPKILLSCALFYCAYRDTIRNMAGNDHHYFKDRTLRLINNSLQDPATALTEDNIASVISMCMYENVRGSNLIITHLKGLRQMIEMRGGINSLPSNQGQQKELAILQDMIHAACSNSPPFMFDIYGPILRDMRTAGFEYFYPQSPLRVVNDAGFARPPSELQTSFEILKDAFDGLEMLCIEAFDPETAKDEAEVFKLRREKFWKRLTRDESEEAPSTEKGKVEDAIRLAAKIHYRACVYRIQHDDEVNVEDMKKLHTIIRKIDLSFWKVAQHVYLWILLTAGAASHGHPGHRPYFVSEILRLGMSIGLFDWRAFRQVVGNFVWLQQFLRQEKSNTQAVC